MKGGGLVSILTGPEGPVQRYIAGEPFSDHPVSILTGPEGPVQLQRHGTAWRGLPVSILTGPEGPVQLSSQPAKSRLSCFNPHRPRRAGATPDARRADLPQPVSILTGPEGPVQLFHFRFPFLARLFQSSPAPKGRCNWSGPCEAVSVPLFQSSPAPKGRCNALGRPNGLSAQCFNPHRPRRAGATTSATTASRLLLKSFNPHRPRRAGATHHVAGFVGKLKMFQSSPAPKGRCNGRFLSKPEVRRAILYLESPPSRHSLRGEGRANLVRKQAELAVRANNSAKELMALSLFLKAHPPKWKRQKE